MDSSGQNSTSISTPSTRGKTDPAWEHVTEGRAHDGNKTFTCLYCGNTIKSGGINRMKKHLAGNYGEVGPCKKVPADVRFRMEDCLKAIREKKRPIEETYEQFIPYGLEIIEWVGVSNVVHMVTDNGANYVAIGRLINETYKTINWSPRAAHCLNLILGEILKMTHINDLATRASKVTRYVYNRPWLVAWLRKRKGWTKTMHPGATHFATTFIALHTTHKYMHNLKALVTSTNFVDSKYAKEKTAKEIIAIILDNKFWNDCLIIVKIVEPLVRLLRIVDGDVKPSIGYVFEGIYRARTGI
ncbi:hypothetical protein Acr_00g0026520 [Actinidia rufa]|uniref:BED-type domain-containing protein n=1 Tax=Actinidia rufa TaxID=165716 RepID=A0A7J0DF09_9ERIC|nr:hypothetical protein Acr_00g0026520 [Actinidia rufa]